jgi:mannosyltransferase OCH1-like enzyme
MCHLFMCRPIRPKQTAAICLSLFIVYLIICFGDELGQTLLLYSHHRSTLSFYNILGEVNVTAQINESESNLRGRAAQRNIQLAESSSTQNVNSTSIRTTNDTEIKIPLIMHRMWRDTNIPEQWKRSFHNCEQAYNQRNWTTILWTDATIRSFLKEHYGWFLPTFDSYPYDIQRVDSARYFILFHFGGVYLDLDVECRDDKDLTDLVRAMESMQKGSMFPLTDPIGMSNDVMFASKGNAFFRQLIDRLPTKNRWYGLPYLTVLYSTGPMFLSLEHLRTNQEVLALSPSLYSKTNARFFRHLRGSTWHYWDASVVKWLSQKRLLVSMSSLLVIVLYRRTRSCARRDYKPHRLSL